MPASTAGGTHVTIGAMTTPPRLLPGLLIGLALVASSYARAADVMTPARVALRDAVVSFLQREAAHAEGSVSIELSEAALPRNTKSCAALQAFLPPGQRAWGRTTVGVRCLEPLWTVYVPARVKVEGDYLVAARPLAAGTTLTSADWAQRHGDVAAQPAGALTRGEQANGRTLRQPVPGGSALLSSHLLVVLAVERGQRVQLVAQGAGFEVANQGVALTPAADGQLVQVRLDSGKVLQGVARAGGRVEVAP